MTNSLVPSHVGYWWRSGTPVRVVEYMGVLKREDGPFSVTVEDDGTWEGPCLTNSQVKELLSNEAAQERLRLADIFNKSAKDYNACAIRHGNRGTSGIQSYRRYKDLSNVLEDVSQYISNNETPPAPRDPWK